MKVTFLRLSGQGFMTFRDPFDIDLATLEGQVTFFKGRNEDEPMADSNGAGKSNLLEALTFVLFGKISKPIPYVEGLINLECQSAQVNLTMLIGDDAYTVTRVRTRKKPMVLLLFKNDEEMLADADPTTKQRRLEKLTGLTFLSYSHSVMFCQDFTAFPNLSAPKRAELLNELSGAGIYHRAALSAKASEDKLSNEIKALETTVAGLRKTLTEFDLPGYNTRMKLWDIEQAKKIAEAEDQIKSLNTMLKEERHEKILAEMRKRVAGFQNEVAVLESSYNKLLPTLDGAEEVHRECNVKGNELHQVNAEALKIETELTKIRDTGRGMCPYCYQDISEEALEKRKTSLSMTLVQKRSKVSSLRVQVEDLNAKVKDFTNLRNRLQDISSKLHRRRGQLAAAEREVANLLNNQDMASIREQLATWNANLVSLLAMDNPVKQAFEAQQRTATELSGQLRTAAQELSKLQDERKYFATWADLFPKIRMALFDQIVLDLESHTQDILSQFSSQLAVFITTERTTASGNVRDEVNIEILTPGGSVSFDGYGGGERQKLRMALSLALSRLISERTGRDYNIIAFDEPNNGLDMVGKASNAAALQALASEGRTVLLIDQDGYFSDIANKTITIVKKDGASYLKGV